MYSYLSDRNHYENYTVQIAEIYYYDWDSKEYVKDYSDERFQMNEVDFKVTFPSYEEADKFYGYEVDREKELSEYKEVFEVATENNQLLAKSGFYEQISVGDTIDITTSDWIYMDGYFYYIIGVQCGETEYLNSEDGLRNVIDMMNKKKGLI
jgi:hypothetical protein